ncbi:iron ABC transporter substrate-binding protein [Tianweitania sp. BSSL-BM11]|uniref:Iron ABC transporter substrate-binding protein n=1 Tax=Tianweitania aestuarii TaxID=2814886 RepID=A0ABS5RZC5_9HYPH|nr:iron ABC transporter substrate-binding protein [Tianweitania aestuarii]MBS9721574.1 iron ABC transporter substrate-binding protein [Tianweitania aestuarii]
MMISRIAALSLLAFSLLSPQAQAQEAGSLIVYNAQHENLAREWAQKFTAETGIRITMRQGADLEMANQILQEGEASPADVFLTENSPGMVLVDKAGLFAPLSQDTLANVPDTFRPSSGNWIGIAARSTVFAYDKTKLTENQLPKSVMDLADPAWNNRWAASAGGADFQAIVGAILALKGEEATRTWLEAMKQGVKPYRGNSAAMKGVNIGEVEGALIYHYYYFGDQARTGENSGNVALHYFRNEDPGAFVSISGAGVLASSKHKPEAERFVQWITAKTGQAVLRDGTSFEYPVGKNEAANPVLVPLADLQAPKLDPDKLDSQKVTEMMTDAGLL